MAQEDIFNDLAVRYEKYNKYYFEGRLQYIVSALKKVEGTKILDLGCGIGTLMVKLHDLFPAFVLDGVDTSEEMIKNAIIKNTSVADAEHLPFADATYDAIIMSDVIEHVDSVDLTMANCTRCIKTGGTVVITTPNPFLVPLLNISGRLGFSFANENQLILANVRNSFKVHGFIILDETTMNLYPFGPKAVRKAFLRIESWLPMSLKNYICFSKCFTLVKG